MNFGLKIGKRDTDFIAGKFSPVKPDILVSDGQWDDFLPRPEYQNIGFETYACVSFSALNCLETLYRKLTGIEINFSDRFIAKASGTTKRGNYMWRVAETIRHCGLVLEERYPAVNTYKEYYKDIPQEIYNEALDFLLNWIIYYEWIEDFEYEIIRALETAPLQVTVKYAVGNGILNPTGKYNHAVMLYGYEMGSYWKIYDHYKGVKKKYAWNYKFGNILRYTLIPKNKIMLKIKDNTLVQLIEGHGGFGLYLDEKLLIDNTADILATFIVRNNGNIKNKVKTLTQLEWDSLPHYNLKWEKI